MKYKNVSDKKLRFRANNKDGIKQVFELNPGDEMESDRLVNVPELEIVSSTLIKKKKRGE